MLELEIVCRRRNKKNKIWITKVINVINVVEIWKFEKLNIWRLLVIIIILELQISVHQKKSKKEDINQKGN